MNKLLLYSDLDNFIVTSIVVTTGIMFLLSWIGAKLKSKKQESIYSSDNDEIDLSDYALSFKNLTVSHKTISFKSKLVLFVLSLAIVLMPLYEFIETLKPIQSFYGFSCLP